MRNKLRRFEILLPLQFNDGREVPGNLIADTINELEAEYGAVSSETQIIQGIWRNEGELYRDNLMRVTVDAEDITASFAFFAALKERLKQRFDQLEIWITTQPIESI